MLFCGSGVLGTGGHCATWLNGVWGRRVRKVRFVLFRASASLMALLPLRNFFVIHVVRLLHSCAAAVVLPFFTFRRSARCSVRGVFAFDGNWISIR